MSAREHENREIKTDTDSERERERKKKRERESLRARERKRKIERRDDTYSSRVLLLCRQRTITGTQISALKYPRVTLQLVRTAGWIVRRERE